MTDSIWARNFADASGGGRARDTLNHHLPTIYLAINAQVYFQFKKFWLWQIKVETFPFAFNLHGEWKMLMMIPPEGDSFIDKEMLSSEGKSRGGCRRMFPFSKFGIFVWPLEVHGKFYGHKFEPRAFSQSFIKGRRKLILPHKLSP